MCPSGCGFVGETWSGHVDLSVARSPFKMATNSLTFDDHVYAVSAGLTDPLAHITLQTVNRAENSVLGCGW